MLIRVLCRDKSRGFVEECNLDSLISRGIVVAFYRFKSKEWVDVENAPIRKKGDNEYKGLERRLRGRSGPASSR